MLKSPDILPGFLRKDVAEIVATVKTTKPHVSGSDLVNPNCVIMKGSTLSSLVWCTAADQTQASSTDFFPVLRP